MEQINLIFLHGFLGLPSDWNPVVKELVNLKLPHFKSHFISLNETEILECRSIQSWAKNFSFQSLDPEMKGPIVLIGYSMGGRVAAEISLINSEVKKCLLVSTNLGFLNEELDLRLVRRKSDDQWAQRFLNDSWSSVITDWNRQPVFAGSIAEPLRREDDYQRIVLAHQLSRWSVADQRSLSEPLKNNLERFEFILGSSDLKLINKYQEFNLTNKVKIINNCGHRILFDQPDDLAKTILDLVSSIA